MYVCARESVCTHVCSCVFIVITFVHYIVELYMYFEYMYMYMYMMYKYPMYMYTGPPSYPVCPHGFAL